MIDQGTGTSCSINNSCTPSIHVDTYTASRESLPNLHDVSSEAFKNKFNVSTIKRNSQNRLNVINKDTSSNLLKETVSGSFRNQNSQLCIGIENNANNSKIKTLKEVSKCKNELEDVVYQAISKRNFVGNSWETATTSGKERNYDDPMCKGYNASLRIRVILNSDKMKNLTKNQKSSRNNCALEIELSGNNHETLKVTNHKNIQANSMVYKEHTTNKIQVVDCKEANLANSYSKTISKTVKRQNTIKESNIGKNPLLLLTQCETFESKQVLPEVVGTSIASELITERTEYKTRKTYSLPNRTKHISYCSDSKLAKRNVQSDLENKFQRSKTENLMQDKFVQTTLKKVKEDVDLTDDQDLIKLGMWLEILNNSEYNIYNQDFCITTQNERMKLAESRNIENERNFQSFLEEIGQYKTLTKDKTMKSRSNFGYPENRTINQKKKDYAHFMQHYGNIQTSHSTLKKRECNTKDTSLESVRLTNVNNPTEEINGREKRNNFYTNVLKKHFSSSSEGPLKKIFQNVLMRLVPSASTEGKIIGNKSEGQSFFAFCSLSDKNSPNLWAKINPFKFCFIKNREKSFSKILDERKISLNDIWNCNSDTFQYSSLPTTDNNDFNFLSDHITKFCNNNYFNRGYQYYFNNNHASNTTRNYPYDTIPVMQCPGGCDLCNPDINKVQNIKKVPH